MKAVDYFAAHAIPAYVARGLSPQVAAEESIILAKTLIEALCYREGHDFDVPGPRGRCTRCDHAASPLADKANENKAPF